MSGFVSLHCPTCNGEIQFYPDSKILFCTHCGRKLLYKDGGLIDIQADAVRKQHSTVAIQQIEEEIASTKKELKKRGKMDWVGDLGLVISILAIVILVVISILAPDLWDRDLDDGNWLLTGCFLTIGVVIFLEIASGVRSNKKLNKRQTELKTHLDDLEVQLKTLEEEVGVGLQELVPGKSLIRSNANPPGYRYSRGLVPKKSTSQQAAIIIVAIIITIAFIAGLSYLLVNVPLSLGANWDGTYTITSAVNPSVNSECTEYVMFSDLIGSTIDVTNNSLHGYSIGPNGQVTITTNQNDGSGTVSVDQVTFFQDANGVAHFTDNVSMDVAKNYSCNGPVCTNPIEGTCHGSYSGIRKP